MQLFWTRILTPEYYEAVKREFAPISSLKNDFAVYYMKEATAAQFIFYAMLFCDKQVSESRFSARTNPQANAAVCICA